MTPDTAAQSAYAASLPDHLRPYWGRLVPSADPRTKLNYCERQARKTPMIPWHNGHPKCLSCGAERSK